MECHLKRVERWFKRCAAACKCGSWNDALIEADCLEAETKGLREKLWRVIAEEHLGIRARGFGGTVFQAFKVASLALVIVMTAVMPLSVDPEANTEISAAPPASIALLTSAESDIINALRESLSSSNNGRVALTVEIPEKPPVTVGPRGAAMASETAISAPQPAEEDKTENPEPRHPSAEEVISLIQAGQRALRVPDPAIRIIR
ncbi:MAG: hypothetical protein LBS53_08365 [Synergistaceae bacterium]|jgi:hypothetical protein|nr:hypothetical protein [Synergistaceae bacterium]